ncbi:hypothetical protein [Sphingobacterium lactis]|uniref:hypothetical protein n=1 Tax=Sphingobacterium lactis TaxID=797291 RepID=UPI003DA4BF2A
MKFYTILFFTCLALTSCKNELNESVLVPLSNEIIESEQKNDSLFLERYNHIRYLVDSSYVPAQKQAIIKNISYSRLIKFMRYAAEAQKKLLNQESFNKDWQSKYGQSFLKFQKDSLKYEAYIDSNSYHKFLKLDFVKVYEKENWLGSDRIAQIAITPLNGNMIRAVSGYLIFDEKSKENEEPLTGVINGNAFFSFKGLASTLINIEAQEVLPSHNLSAFIDLPKEIVEQKFEVKFEVAELIVKDRYIDVTLEKVPIEFIMFKKSNYSEQNKNFFIIKTIDSTYLPKPQYANNRLKKDFIKKFKEEYEFFN